MTMTTNTAKAARRVYEDVFEMLPSEENPTPMVRIGRLNPSPAFSWYEANTGQPIARAVACYLAGRA